MDNFTKTLLLLTDSISLDSISILARDNIISYALPCALFICALLLINVFSTYKFLSFKILLSWVISCFISLFFITSGDLDSILLISSVNSQVILSFFSSTIMLIFYIFTIISSKPHKKRKNFGYNRLWIGILSFIVSCAFCCFFNIMLFVAWRLFY